ncbi:hypothetical protein [Candidatus Uabimicrobium sp. HlEnr_7]|uniref:hypothetical protein n=1 Tax=Candidatus Uabimicrobium helgolandensis TaxID=3095367 RepID=UPI0035586C71
MNLNKYVEIRCKSLFLQHFNKNPPIVFAKNFFPLVHLPKNTYESRLSSFELSHNKWHPIMNNILFGNYVGEFLQTKLYFSSIQNNPIKEISNPDLGATILTFARSSTFPLFNHKQLSIYKNDIKVGYINLDIYIRPILSKKDIFHKPVVLFPFSADEIVIYYSGFLANSKQLYCMSTTNDWDSHILQKMQRIRSGWTTIIQKTNGAEYIELAFTNEEEVWDNQNDNNWLFRESSWC